MPRHTIILLILVINSFTATGQPDFPNFGSFSNEELEIKECSFDPEADAIILLDQANAIHDEGKLLTNHRIRLKILKDKGIERGNIRIPFFTRDNFEYIRNLEAYSYSDNGSGRIIVTPVDKKSFYIQKEDNVYSWVKFAIPNVKKGTIIEYQYQSVMKNYGGLDKWHFQSELPTLMSCFDVELPPNTEFAYQVMKKPDYYLRINPNQARGSIYFEMKNIPGLRFEPYMTAVRDYLQRVEFQLSGYLGSFGYKKTFAQTWKELANELDTDKYFGKSFRKDFTGLDALRAEVGSQNSPEQKIHIIYEFARKYFTWNGYYGKYTTDGLKELWDKKTGHAGEINLLLVNLFRIFDLEAYPLLVAERDYGSIDTTYPYLDKFNKTVAYVAVGNKYYILDASEKFIPMDIFPYSLLNTYAFLVDKEKFKLFKITSEKGYNLSISLKGELNKAGLLTGTAEMTAKDYARQILEEKLRKSETDYIREDLAEPYPGLVIDSFTHHETDDPDKTLVQKVTFHTELNTNAGYVPFKYNLFSGLSKNPFSSYLRFTNIDFGYPFWVRIEEEVQLPPGCVVEDLPANKKLVTPDRDISIDREIKKAQNRLVIKIQFNQTATMFSHDEYPQLRAFYAAMVKLLDEPVVIKLAK